MITMFNLLTKPAIPGEDGRPTCSHDYRDYSSV